MNKELFTRILSSIILMPLAFFFIIEGAIFFNFFTLVIFLIAIYEWHFLSLKKNYYLLGFLFIALSFYTFYDLRNEGDFLIFLLILIICISTDIGGYIFGKIIKGPKLTKISPNKTYSGMFGSFVLSVVALHIYFNNLSFLKLANNQYELGVKLICIVLSISLVSQLGDLIISYFKRKSNIKNTGKIIPGHGGLLDRIDGMIFAFPFTYLLIKIL